MNKIFKLKVANLISNSYYDNLITNIAKELYKEDKNLSKLITNPNEDPFQRKLIVDIDTKLVDFIYNDLINHKNLRPSEIKQEYASNQVLKQLIYNNDFNILKDILINKDFESSKLKELLTKELYPSTFKQNFEHNYSHYIVQIDSKLNQKLDLLNNILNNVTIDQKKKITMDYTKSLINSIYEISKDQINDKNEINWCTIEEQMKVYESNLNQYIDYQNIFNKDYLTKIISIFVYTNINNKDEINDVYLLSILNYCGLKKETQFEILKECYNHSDAILKTFLHDIENKEDFFNNKILLKISRNNNDFVDLTKFSEERINLLKDLINLIKEETSLKYKENMIESLNNKFHLNVKLENLDYIMFVSENTIKDLDKDQFKDLYYESNNERLLKFEEKLSSVISLDI